MAAESVIVRHMSKPKTFTDILKLWPSFADLARDLGLPYTTVASWAARNTIPVAYWQPLIKIANKRNITGLSVELFLKLKARGIKPRPSSRAVAPVVAAE